VRTRPSARRTGSSGKNTTRVASLVDEKEIKKEIKNCGMRERPIGHRSRVNPKRDRGHRWGERTGESQKGAEWQTSLSFFLYLSSFVSFSLPLSLSRGVERYSFRGGGRLNEAVVVAEEEVNVEEEEAVEDEVRPINHGIIIESVISKAC